MALLVTDSDATRPPARVRGRRWTRCSGGCTPTSTSPGADLPGALRGDRAGPAGGPARASCRASLLVAAAGVQVGDRRVVLTPSGVLAGVPGGCCPGSHGRSITVARSATSWLLRSGPTPVRIGSAGFVAGPRVGRAEAEVAAAAARLAALERPCRVAEATARGGLGPGRPRRRPARVGARSALGREPVVLRGRAGGRPVVRLRHRPAAPRCRDVVLLSACEVGRSQVRYGEELVGMTTAWLHAGVRCVVASRRGGQRRRRARRTGRRPRRAGRRPGPGGGARPAAALPTRGRRRAGAVRLLLLRYQAARRACSAWRSGLRPRATTPGRHTMVHVVTDPPSGKVLRVPAGPASSSASAGA